MKRYQIKISRSKSIKWNKIINYKKRMPVKICLNKFKIRKPTKIIEIVKVSYRINLN